MENQTILKQIIKLAAKKAGKDKVKVDKLFMCELFGEIYQNSKSERKDEKILAFAAKMGFEVIVIPESN